MISEEENVLLLSQEHCLSDQVMAACRINQRSDAGGMPGLNASSLETLVQLVGMGLGVTLVPALSVHGGRLATDRVILRQASIADAVRQIRLVYRTSFPSREGALTLLARIICKVLPNTVQLDQTLAQ